MPLSQVRTQATLPQDTIIEEEVLTTHEDKISDAETDHAVDEVMRTTVFFSRMAFLVAVLPRSLGEM